MQSHLRGDNEQFITIATQVADHEAQQGHTHIANRMKQLIDKAKGKNSRAQNNVFPVVQLNPELDAILAVSQPRVRLIDLAFPPEQQKAFERIIHEYRQQTKLRSYNLEPRRKLLLCGPPGTGKTATASALAHELKLPLFTVRLDGLIKSFMGETALKLRRVFDSIRTTSGLYFFDEFDAIGSDRNSPNDVGEMRRVLNSFLQFLEQDESDSLIVAATNYKKLLDFALFRRFDDVIPYELPTHEQIRPLIEKRLASFPCDINDWPKLENISAGLSHAEITRACDDAAKITVLDGEGHVSMKNITDMLEARARAKN